MLQGTFINDMKIWDTWLPSGTLHLIFRTVVQTREDILLLNYRQALKNHLNIVFSDVCYTHESINSDSTLINYRKTSQVTTKICTCTETT